MPSCHPADDRARPRSASIQLQVTNAFNGSDLATAVALDANNTAGGLAVVSSFPCSPACPKGSTGMSCPHLPGPHSPPQTPSCFCLGWSGLFVARVV